MDDYDFLDQEQEEAIQQFFQNFSIDKRTQLKEKFISLWDKLGAVSYTHLDVYKRQILHSCHSADSRRGDCSPQRIECDA